jgi:hypothetical protein
MPLELDKTGRIKCKSLTKDEAAAIDGLLSEWQANFRRQQERSEEMVACPGAAEQYGKQLDYARHAWSALEWCRAQLHQRRQSRQTYGAHRGRSQKPKGRRPRRTG